MTQKSTGHRLSVSIQKEDKYYRTEKSTTVRTLLRELLKLPIPYILYLDLPSYDDKVTFVFPHIRVSYEEETEETNVGHGCFLLLFFEHIVSTDEFYFDTYVFSLRLEFKSIQW